MNHTGKTIFTHMGHIIRGHIIRMYHMIWFTSRWSSVARAIREKFSYRKVVEKRPHRTIYGTRADRFEVVFLQPPYGRGNFLDSMPLPLSEDQSQTSSYMPEYNAL